MNPQHREVNRAFFADGMAADDALAVLMTVPQFAPRRDAAAARGATPPPLKAATHPQLPPPAAKPKPKKKNKAQAAAAEASFLERMEFVAWEASAREAIEDMAVPLLEELRKRADRRTYFGPAGRHRGKELVRHLRADASEWRGRHAMAAVAFVVVGYISDGVPVPAHMPMLLHLVGLRSEACTDCNVPVSLDAGLRRQLPLVGTTAHLVRRAALQRRHAECIDCCFSRFPLSPQDTLKALKAVVTGGRPHGPLASVHEQRACDVVRVLLSHLWHAKIKCASGDEHVTSCAVGAPLVATAAEHGRVPILRTLLWYRFPVRGSVHVVPLVRAAGAGDLVTAQMLIKWGADVHDTDREFDTGRWGTQGINALGAAARWERVGMLRFLVANGADVNRGPARVPLDLAAGVVGGRQTSRGNTHLEAVRLLLELGANVHARCGLNGWSAADYAVSPRLASDGLYELLSMLERAATAAEGVRVAARRAQGLADDDADELAALWRPVAGGRHGRVAAPPPFARLMVTEAHAKWLRNVIVELAPSTKEKEKTHVDPMKK